MIPQGLVLYYVHSSFSHKSQKLEATQMSLNNNKKRIQKMWYIYTMKCYSAIKIKDIINFAGKWIDLENIILSEVTPTQNDIPDVYSLIVYISQKVQNTHDTPPKTVRS